MKDRISDIRISALVLGGVLAFGSAVQNSLAGGSALTGEELWAANCNRCHNARNAEEYSDEDWAVIMQHMRVTCGLTGEETKKVLKYLQENN